MVPDHAAKSDGVGESRFAGSEAEIDIFGAVVEFFVKTTELLPEVARNEQASARDSGHEAMARARAAAGLRTRNWSHIVLGFAFGSHVDACVVNRPGGGVELNITDGTGFRRRLVKGEHWLQPPRRKDKIVIEKNEKISRGCRGGTVICGSVPEILLVKDDSEAGILKCSQPLARTVGAAVVGENDFVIEIGGQRSVQAL